MLQPLARNLIATAPPIPRHDAPRPTHGDNSWFSSSFDLRRGLTVIEDGNDTTAWCERAFQPAG